MISARYASCWEDVRAATRRSSSARSVANKRIRVRRGLDRGMCEGTFFISHYNRRASASIPYLHQPAGRGTRGVYEAYVNGARVGDERLAPGWTDYNTRIQYQTHDVTPLIQGGDNVLAVRLGDGWYTGNVGFWGRQRYGDAPAV